MSKKSSRPRIENEDQYEALRDLGMNKQKAARIANTPDMGMKGGKAKNTKNVPKGTFINKPGR
jgi:hypothetical protein